mgnify:CR=1 FL=1
MTTSWPDGKQRCAWCNPRNAAYIHYHDEEWGVPVHDDGVLFAMLILESFQAGLSWECVLNKRDAFAAAFDHFDAVKISQYDAANPQQAENQGSCKQRGYFPGHTEGMGQF